eukprot:455337-Pleurochrysis_carterae.AAC.1
MSYQTQMSRNIKVTYKGIIPSYQGAAPIHCRNEDGVNLPDTYTRRVLVPHLRMCHGVDGLRCAGRRHRDGGRPMAVALLPAPVRAQARAPYVRYSASSTQCLVE